MRVFAVIAILALAIGIAMTNPRRVPDLRPIAIHDPVVDDTPLHAHLRANPTGLLPNTPQP